MKFVPMIVLGFALLLAGCEHTFDRAELRAASNVYQQDIFACRAKQIRRTVKNYSEFAGCQVAAERAFAMTIHLQKMEAFDAYAAKMLALGADRDAGRLSLEQTRVRATTIRNEYWAACACNLTVAPAGPDLAPYGTERP
jgi:hypothetical protein